MPNYLALTDVGIRRLALPATGTTTYWDTTEKRLGVRVSPKGTRTFIALVGSGTRHKLGRYPHLSLAVAREETRKLLAKKTLGTYEKPNTITWDGAIKAYLAACEEKNRPRTVSEYKRHLAHFPFAARRLTTIKKRDVAAELAKITAKGEREHALVSAKVFLSWCANEGYIDASPVTALKSIQSTARRKQEAAKPKRVLSTAELKEVLTTALSHPYPFGSIVALLVLTGQRRNEIASLEWAHVMASSVTIPAEIAKNGIEHTIPYDSLARRVLDALPDHAREGRYLFPASREHVRGKPTGFFNGWGKAKNAFDAKLKNVAPYTLHDLRRTFATVMQSLGVSLEVREKLLNHISGTQAGVAGIYGRYGYEEEMKEAVARYDAFLLALLSQNSSSKISE